MVKISFSLKLKTPLYRRTSN